MTVRDWNQWPAQEPPSDFTSRTVDLLLQGDTKSESNVRPLRRRRRLWVGVFALAAAFAAGTSWAMIHQGVFRAEQPAVAPEPPAASSAVPAPVAAPSSVRRFVELPVEVEPEPPPAPKRTTAQPIPSAPPPPVSASASAPPKVIVVPRCDCEPGATMCSCYN
jgi:hypothetical protein